MNKTAIHHEHGKGDNPLIAVMASVTGAAAQEHDNAPPGVNSVSLKAGHEPDAFNVKGILYVPALVVLTLVVTYVLVQVIFTSLLNPEAPPGTNGQVASLNDLDFNSRIGRISSTEPREVLARAATAYPQPRLEYLQEQAGNDPIFYRSKRALQERNSPEVRPEDLRPENYVDPATGRKILADYTFVSDKNKNMVRIPINEAIHMFEHGKLKLPVKSEPALVPDSSDTKAKLSNGGVPSPPPTGEGSKVPQELHNGEPGNKHKH